MAVLKCNTGILLFSLFKSCIFWTVEFLLNSVFGSGFCSYDSFFPFSKTSEGHVSFTVLYEDFFPLFFWLSLENNFWRINCEMDFGIDYLEGGLNCLKAINCFLWSVFTCCLHIWWSFQSMFKGWYWKWLCKKKTNKKKPPIFGFHAQ